MRFTFIQIKGKLNRGLAVIHTYQALKGDELSEEEFFLASMLGWSLEWVIVSPIYTGNFV